MNPPVSNQAPNHSGSLLDKLIWRRAIAPIAAEWDGLVPRDLPHLRAGFLRAVERGGMGQEPSYLLAYHGGQLAAVALAYTVLMDTMASAPPGVRHWVARVRRRVPGFLWGPMRVCGSPVSNAESGVYVDPRLSPVVRRHIFAQVAHQVVSSASFRHVIFFKDFNQEALCEYASDLGHMGFFPVDPGPGTRLVLPWDSFDHYLKAMQKRYRRRIIADLKAGEALDIQLLDTFANLAPTVAALYASVLARAKYNLETATEPFFAAVSEFDQARLLVARQRSTGEVVGVNLLLFGDACMHNLYMGLDYAQNERFHTYFNLVEHSLRHALERRCRVCYLGPASYEFKTRLGATPVPVTAFMKHRLWPIHYLLRSSRDKMFPKSEVPTHDVFRAE